MQIKRFEATSMAEALKQVKREFGAEAVILSACTRRPAGGLLAPLRKAVVEVTAAVDRREGPPREETPARARRLWRAAAPRAGSVSQPIMRGGNVAIERHGEQARWEGNRRQTPADSPLRWEWDLRAAGIDQRHLPEIVRNLTRRTGEGERGAENLSLVAALSDLLAERQVAAAAPEFGHGRRYALAAVGPNGVGKTTTLVKLADLYRRSAGSRVGLLTLDNRRIGGAEQMRTYARILDLPFTAASTPDQIAVALDQMADVDLLLVDTPGAGPSDRESIGRLGLLLRSIPKVEIHLLFSAATRDEDVRHLLEGYRAMPVTRLIVTRTDETRRPGAILNPSLETGLPIAYLSQGPVVPDDLSTATPRLLAHIVASAPAEPSQPARGADERPSPDEPEEGGPACGTVESFVANDHSDIFHRNDCKWTRNIKPAHRVWFASPEEARAKHFKPCRTCNPEHGEQVEAPSSAGPLTAPVAAQRSVSRG